MTGVATVRGMRCTACGYTSVPVQHFGCERCGGFGDDFTEVALDGRGVVLAVVEVAEHPNKDVAVPVTIGKVLLAEGPVVRARLSPGCRVGGRARATARDGVLVFAAETAEGEAR